MRKTILGIGLALIGLSAASQTLIQPYQIKASTNDFTKMASVGCTNVQQLLMWQGLHWDDGLNYATSNYAILSSNTTVALSTLNSNVNTSLTNTVSNLTATVSELMANVCTNGFLATNTVQQTVSSGASQQMTLDGELYDSGSEWVSPSFTPKSNGLWRIGALFDFNQGDPTTSFGRVIIKLYKGGAPYVDFHRHSQYQAGTQQIIGGELEIKVTAGDVYSVYVTEDGGVSMTNSVGKGRVWGIKERSL